MTPTADVSASERVNDAVCQQLFSLNSTEGGLEYQREYERLEIVTSHGLKPLSEHLRLNQQALENSTRIFFTS